MNAVDVKEYHGMTFFQLALSPRVQHAFGTRQGWQGILGAFDASPSQLLTLEQVHGADVLIVKDDPETLSRPLMYDAVVTDRKGVAVGIWTADCVPILMVDAVNGVIAAVHAGWRGLWRGIVRHTVSAMKKTFGTSANNVLVGMGPGIGPCCYEVGREVVDLFRSAHDDCHLFLLERDGRSYLDLLSASQVQLSEQGIPAGNIKSVPLCTVCREDLFFSHRRDGETGRQLSCIMLG